MSEAVFEVTCWLANTNPDNQLGFEIWIDTQKIFDSSEIQHQLTISCFTTLGPGTHVAKFVMKNKNSSHTKIDSTGKITSDACLILKDVKFDGFEVDQKIIDQAVYQHNYNGNGDTVQERFYRTFGCNGVVTLPLSTPVYDWLSNTYE